MLWVWGGGGVGARAILRHSARVVFIEPAISVHLAKVGVALRALEANAPSPNGPLCGDREGRAATETCSAGGAGALLEEGQGEEVVVRLREVRRGEQL
eukprot:scaffold10719_cov101-Isochrysis_galbana.AAC.1